MILLNFYSSSSFDVTLSESYASEHISSDTMPIVDPTRSGAVTTWSINGTGTNIDWEQPTLQYAAEGNTSYPPVWRIYELPDANVASSFHFKYACHCR